MYPYTTWFYGNGMLFFSLCGVLLLNEHSSSVCRSWQLGPREARCVSEYNNSVDNTGSESGDLVSVEKKIPTS